MLALNFDNPWIVDVRAHKRRYPTWLTLSFALGFAGALLVLARVFATTLARLLGHLSGQLSIPQPDLVGRSGAEALVFGCFLGVGLASAAVEGRSALRLSLKWPSQVVVGLILGAAVLLSGVAIVWLAGGVAPAAGPDPAATLFGIGLSASLTIFQCLSEEVYFRGWLQPSLCASWGPWLGLAATSLIFGGLHLIAAAHSPLAFANLVLGGLMFGLLALRSGSLVAAVAAHAGWNWTESGALGLTPEPGGSLIHLRVQGVGLLSGGIDGMNGSLAMTLSLSFAVCSLILAKPTASGPP